MPWGLACIGWCPSSTAAWVSASASAFVSGRRPANVVDGSGPVSAGVTVVSSPDGSADALTTMMATAIAIPAPAVRTRRPCALRSVTAPHP